MNNFDMFKNMNFDELVDWLFKYSSYEDNPWDKWFNDTYCNNAKCPVEKVYIKDYGREMSFCWCELHGKCKFFPEFEDIPSGKEIIKMWLLLRSEC